MKVLRWLFNLWMANPVADILLGSAAGYLAVQFFGKSLQHATGQGNFAAIVAGICAAAVGFSITAITILLSVTPGARLKAVFQSAGYPLIRLIMRSLLVLIVVANIFAYSSLANWHSHLTFGIFIGLAVASGLMQLRLTSIFYQVFALLILESKQAE